MTVQSYDSFLRGKIRVASATGLDIDPSLINPAGAPHCRAIVAWALHGGQRAIFANFGLHKTFMQIELMRLIAIETAGLCLIVLPLGVRQEFFAEAEERFHGDYAVRLKFIQKDADLKGGAVVPGDGPLIYLTNYESVRDGKIDVSAFTAVSLDEAAVLRGYLRAAEQKIAVPDMFAALGLEAAE